MKNLVLARKHLYEKYMTSTGALKYALRKEWKNIDELILREMKESYDIRKYTDEIGREYWQLYPTNPYASDIPDRLDWKYNAFIGKFEKLVTDNTLYDLAEAIYVNNEGSNVWSDEPKADVNC